MRVKASGIVFAGLVAVAVLGIGACAKETSVVGKWKGKIDMPEPKTEQEKAMAKMMEGFAGMMTPDLDLREDKTFTMNMMIPIEGTWVQSGKTVTLTANKIMGMTVDEAQKMAAQQNKGVTQNQDLQKPMILTISEDGKSMSMQGEGAQKGTITFARNESK